jgi:hypothetical protein
MEAAWVSETFVSNHNKRASQHRSLQHDFQLKNNVDVKSRVQYQFHFNRVAGGKACRMQTSALRVRLCEDNKAVKTEPP